MNQDVLATLQDEMRECRRCSDVGFPIVPGAILSGEASAKILLVGQAPGATEVATNRPFDGPAGRRLFRWLERAGFAEDEFRKRHYIAAVTRCCRSATLSLARARRLRGGEWPADRPG